MDISRKLGKFRRDPAGFFLDSRLLPFRLAGYMYARHARRKAAQAYREGGAGIKISVIMPAYNAAEWIDAAIQSLLVQTHAPAEIIIIDDSSHDATAEKIKHWQRRDPRIIGFASERNIGPYACKNYGLQQAKHDIIAFMDADDISLPDRLSLQLGSLLNANAIACLCRRAYKDRHMQPVSINGRRNSTALCALMVRRQAALSRVGYFDCVPFAADSEYADRLRLVYGPHSVCLLPFVLYHARQHEASITHSGAGAHIWSGKAADELQTSGSPLRKAYHNAYTSWHRRMSGLPVTEAGAPFPLPDGIRRQSAGAMKKL